MNTRHFTVNLIIAAAAAAPLMAQAASSTVTHDGFVQVGSETLHHVGSPAGNLGKTRAEVRAELDAYRVNPVSPDGWLQRGEELLFVGLPTSGTPGKSRAEVRAEQAAADGVSTDGFRQLNAETLVYVGLPEAVRVAGTDSALAPIMAKLANRPAAATQGATDPQSRLRELVSASIGYAASPAVAEPMTDRPVAVSPSTNGQGFGNKQIRELVFGARS